MSRATLLLALVLVTGGCGARSGIGGLDASPAEDGGPGDAGPEDAGPEDAAPDTEPPCTPSAERCGGGDDDCDGRVDEGLGFGPLAEPIVVADPRVELGPFNEDLVSTPDGLLAIWRVSFDGTDPMPNVRVRPLDGDGMPAAEPRDLLERSVTRGPRFAKSAGSSHAFVYCGRFGADDLTTAWRIDAEGRTIGDEIARRDASDASCGAAEPDILWSGERHFIAWIDNRGDPAGFETQLDIAGERLESHEVMVLGEGDLSATTRLGQSGDRVLLAWGARPEPRVSTLRLMVLGRDGTRIAAPMEVGMPPPFPGEDRADWGMLRILPRDGGFLVLADNRFGGGMFRMLVSRGGRVVEGPALVDGVPEVDTDSLRAVPRPGGGVYATIVADGQLQVLRLEQDGRLIDSTPVAEAPPMSLRAWPALVTRGDRLFVSWTEGLEFGGERPQVRIRPFGCVP